MSYTALYRTYRPTKFSDMVGEEHITRTLRNQIMAGRVGHAYLFCGGRGTGKTTSAKILARAVNCLNIKDGEPCNECEICKEILDGSLTDVVEMDAASNNSVDDIRIIRDEVNFLPTKAKYRVYIIDEVHMLSGGAFNALLKTLEEPPEHVKFILATTEPQKIPTTILSRCQRFDYKKISNEDIIKRLKIICEDANIKINDAALQIIAILSEGAMRDAISILERCSQENVDEITEQNVKDLVGIPSLTYVSKITRAMFECNEIDALQAINEVLNEGKDLYNFLWEVIKYIKDILVYKATNSLELYSEEEINEINSLANIVSKDRILQIIYELSELENNIKWSDQKLIMFQTAIIKICSSSNNDGVSSNVVSNNANNVFNTNLVNIDNRDIRDNNYSKNNKDINYSNDSRNNINNASIISNMGSTDSNLNSNGSNSIIQELLHRVEELENKLKNIDQSQIVQKTKNDTISKTIKNENKQTVESKPSREKAEPATQFTEYWKKVINSLRQNKKMMLYTTLLNSRAIQIDDSNIEIEFPSGLTPFNEKVINDLNNRNDLKKVIFSVTGKELNIKIKDGSAKPVKPNDTSKSLEDLGIDIKIID